MVKTQTLPEQSLSDIKVLEPDVFMIYGPSGGGKTVMSSTFPAPLRYIDCDDGIKSIKWAIREGICPHDEDDFIRAVPFDETDERGVITSGTGWWQMIDKINEWLGDDQIAEWSTLVIDPVTTVNRFALTAGMDVTANLPSKNPAKTETKSVTRQVGVMMPVVSDYKPAKGFMYQFVDQLRRIAREHGKYVVLLCHEREITSTSGGIGDEPNVIGIEPSLIGSQRKDIVKDLDEVWHIKNRGTKKKPEFMIQTVGDAVTVAKSRYGCLPIRMEANFQAVMETVKEYWGDA